MRLVNELYRAQPFYGSRQMSWHLRGEGWRADRNKVRRLMRKVGLVAKDLNMGLCRVVYIPPSGTVIEVLQAVGGPLGLEERRKWARPVTPSPRRPCSSARPVNAPG